MTGRGAHADACKHALGHREVARGNPGKRLLHESSPYLGGLSAAYDAYLGIPHLSVGILAYPHGCHHVGREAHKPGIGVAVGGSGFACGRTADVGPPSCSARRVNDAAHHVGNDIRGALIQDYLPPGHVGFKENAA